MSDTQRRERPIIFSETIPALLAGKKTMTRRVCRVQPEPWKNHWQEGGGSPSDWRPAPCDDGTWDLVSTFAASEVPGFGRCPHGAPGDRLYVKETYQIIGGIDDPPQTVYRADGVDYSEYENEDGRRFCWRSPIYMPRVRSRITLDIESVRVQRLQDITEEDARAEGMHWSDGNPVNGMATSLIVSARDEFRHAWYRINEKRAPWESNCWVWAISFRRIQ